MTKFDKAFNSIMESVKLVKERDEYNFEVYPGMDTPGIDGILVSEILPNDPAGDDIFMLSTEISMPYSVHPGERQTWDYPGSEPSAEIEDVIYHNPTIQRYNQETDEYTDVSPESIGPDVYNSLMAKLKAQAEEVAINDAYENIDTRYGGEY